MRPFRIARTMRNASHGQERDTVVGVWSKLWLHLRSPAASDLNCNFPSTSSPCVRRYKEAGYERRLGQTLANICNIDEDYWTPLWTMVSPPTIYMIDSTQLWTGCILHTIRIWNACLQWRLVLLSCLALCQSAAVAVSTIWQCMHQSSSAVASTWGCQLMSEASTPAFAHYSKVMLGNWIGASGLWTLATTKYSVLAVTSIIVVA